MEEKDKVYLTVKEFAARADVSNKAIYQQVEGRLKPYCIEVNHQKMIDAAALDKFYGENKTIQGGQVKLSEVKSRLESEKEATIEALRMMIEELKKDKEALQVDKEKLQKDKEGLQKDKDDLQRDKDYLRKETEKWQSLYAIEQKKNQEQKKEEKSTIIDDDTFKDITKAEAVEPETEEPGAAAAATEPQTPGIEPGTEPQLPQTFLGKIKFVFTKQKK